MKRSAMILAGLLLAACGGSSRAGEPGRDDNGGVRAGPVGPGHHCSDNCGHFVHRQILYHLENHVHGGDCGHHKIGGTWYYVKPEGGDACRHNSYCGHYVHRGSWYRVESHQHGNGCGHLYRDGVWYLE
jgi:hypothetical protein